MKQCPECGAYASDEDVFCGECGRPLIEGLPAATPEPTPDRPEPLAERLLLVPPSPGPAVAAPAQKKSTLPVVRLLVLGSLTVGLLCVFVAGIVVWLGTRKAEPQPVPGILLYEDDFSDPQGGWDVYDDDDSWAGYRDGEYGLAVYWDNYMTWGNPDPQDQAVPANIEVEVDARQVEGPLDNNFGLLVRYQPGDDDFYWFQISGDGYYSVDLKQGEEWTSLVAWEESDAIRQGLDVTNHLLVVCYGDQFSFYANETYLTGFHDSSLGSGTIGLAVGTFDEPGAEIHFDNLRVRALQE
jgi:hypothetical protein